MKEWFANNKVTQNKGLSKRFADSRNSIVSDNILLFTEELNPCDPYNKICRSSSSQWLNKVLSRFLRFSRSFVLCSKNKWQRMASKPCQIQ